jgi:hypothetical protein
MLRCISTTDFDVELITPVATTDNNWLAYIGAKRFQDFLAQLLQDRNILRRYIVVNSAGLGRCGTLEFSERKVF